MFTFGNPVVAGTTLVRPAINSPNFAAGSTGWAIRADGSAEFNNVTIRGGLVEGAAGLWYNGPPALGNLAISITQTGGTDVYGNTYLGGVWLYGTGGSSIALRDVIGNPQLIFQPASVTHLTIQPTIIAASYNAGAANEYLQVVLTSGKESGNADAALQLFSASADNTIAAYAAIEFGGQVGAFVTAAGLVACQPGTAATPETWHSLGTCGATGCTLQQARYRITPDGETELDISFVAGAGGSTAGTYTFTTTLPSSPGNYQFNGNYLRAYEFSYNAAIVGGSQNAIVAVDGSGTGSPGRVRVTLPALASGVVLTATPRIPLN